jgi:hypothetical protein
VNKVHTCFSLKQHVNVFPTNLARLPQSERVAIHAIYRQLAIHRRRCSLRIVQALPHAILSSAFQHNLASMLYQGPRLVVESLITRHLPSSHVGSSQICYVLAVSSCQPYYDTTILYQCTLVCSKYISTTTSSLISFLAFLLSVCFLLRSFLRVLGRSLAQIAILGKTLHTLWSWFFNIRP